MIKIVIKIYCRVNDEHQSDASLQQLLSDFSSLTFEEPSSTSFDAVCKKCAKECHIAPTYFTLFALRDTATEFWLKPCLTLEEYLRTSKKQNINVEFRVRFSFHSEGNNLTEQAHRYSSYNGSCKPVMTDKVITYLFHQRRSDFLQGKFPISDSCTDKMAAALGVAVVDILRLAHEKDRDLHAMENQIKRFKKLLPEYCQTELRSMHFCNRFRVRRKFKHYLHHLSETMAGSANTQRSAAYFHSKYLRNLEMVVGFDCFEMYNIVSKSGFCEDCTNIIVGPNCGIMKVDKSGEKERWCDFQDITSLSIRQHSDENNEHIFLVNLSKMNGTLLSLCLASSVEAENLASCIDGYYQLLTDADHFLCREICSPSLIQRLECFCHGPVTSAHAEEIIRKQSSIQLGDCFLRESVESYDEYFMNTVVLCRPNIEIRNYKLNRENGLLGIYGDGPSHIYQNLSSLLDAYRSADHAHEVPFRINRCIHPNGKEKSNLVICRSSDDHVKHTVDTEQSNGISKPTVFLIQKDYTFLQHLGCGKFTEVMLYANKENKGHKVVLKKVFDVEKSAHVDDSFQEAMFMLNFLKNDYIVQQIGMMKNMMVLEYVPLGSIIEHFKQTSRKECEKWFWYVIWQLAHACTFMEDKECPHGSIRGKNILLWHNSPWPHIKLSDPGVRTETIRNNIPQPVLPAPWLAFEFCKIGSTRPLEWKPTVNADKWSFATTICEICQWSREVQSADAYCLTDELKQRYLTQHVMDIPEALCEERISSLIRDCWCNEPTKRPSFKRILREFGELLPDDFVAQVPSQSKSLIESGTTVPDLNSYQDEMLVKIKELGAGNFGLVELYYYDRYHNGRTEQVAVKTLKEKSNPKTTQEFNNEIETMRRINNKYVVKLQGIAEPSLRIVMEYLPLGSLAQFLSKQKNKRVRLSTLHPLLLKFASQIAQGMLALQEKRLVHRDLALRNILLAQDSHDTPPYVKISDFGLSRILKANSECYVGNPQAFPAQWYAPECLLNDGPNSRHSFQSDVWSFGITLWEMFSYGQRPSYELQSLNHHNLSVLHDLLQRGERLRKPSQCPDAVYREMEKCWEYEPERRTNFEDLQRQFDVLKRQHDTGNGRPPV
ncbi:unnamed protein product [Clavelina lepadiformis]|uniref:non-specific protein-tyrosine kinase n=1 Tax=Clavelina lepadiformis TaxID=159417 RepID=A0ABP0GDA6_CLALP